MKKNNQKNKIRCCLNCKNWRVFTQNRFVCRGMCDISCGANTSTTKDFCCGKFELTKELQKTLDEIEQARKENQFKMIDEGYLKTKEDLLPDEFAYMECGKDLFRYSKRTQKTEKFVPTSSLGMYYGPPNGVPLRIYNENDFGEWVDVKSGENKTND